MTLHNIGTTLSISGGTLNFLLGVPLTIPSLTMSSGFLNTPNDLTVAGLLTWTGGTMQGAGTTTAQGGMTLAGTTKTLDGRNLTNPGTATWTAGHINFDKGAVLTNTGLLDDQGGANLNYTFGAAPSVVNSGTLRITTSSNTFISVPLTSSGLIDVHGSGALHLSGGGTIGGTLQGAA